MPNIGIGIITYNRPDFLKRCVESICSEWVDDLIIINDGDKITTDFGYTLINNETNLGVCKSKNIALNYLLDNNDYIFLVEDDMVFKGNVFEKYIEAHKTTGIHHFTYGYHGEYNKNNGQPNPIKIINYGKVKIALNRHSVGAVAFFTKESLKCVGLFDENYSNFNNAFDHVDHSYMLAKGGYSTPYWWWADINESWKYIEEQAPADSNTTIRNNKDWVENVKKSAKYFDIKHGFMPCWGNCVPLKDIDEVITDLKKFKKNTER